MVTVGLEEGVRCIHYDRTKCISKEIVYLKWIWFNYIGIGTSSADNKHMSLVIASGSIKTGRGVAWLNQNFTLFTIVTMETGTSEIYISEKIKVSIIGARKKVIC